MSYQYMADRAQHCYPSREVFTKLNELPASSTMAESGEIFDPEHVLLDRETHIAYRKEVFDQDEQLPRELIVRDRRYTVDEICQLCERSGFEVIAMGFVTAGNFQLVEEASIEPTKEILVLC